MIDPGLIRKIEKMQKDIERAALADLPYKAAAWTPTTFGGFDPQPTNVKCRYALLGKLCVASVYFASLGTSSGTSFTITAPFQAANITNMVWYSTWSDGWDASANLTTPGRVYIIYNTTSIVLNKTTAGGLWTATGSKGANFSIAYEVI